METLRPPRGDRAILLFLILALVPSILLQDCRGKGGPSPTTPIPNLSLELTAGGFVLPVGITHAGDGSGRLFIVEQGGLVRIIRNGQVVTAPFLDVSSRLKSSSGEQGLLGIAFPPGYGTTTSALYTNYTGTQGIGDTVISRFTTTSDPDIADPVSEEILLRGLRYSSRLCR